MRREVVGYLQALPRAAHFIATRDSQAVALWQLLPHETPRNELFAGWRRIFKVRVAPGSLGAWGLGRARAWLPRQGAATQAPPQAHPCPGSSLPGARP